jgi:prepilin-type N-terminal cleavage/methylation domain-containing protein/prepilin-type processing-associated H-X9-DG protein
MRNRPLPIPCNIPARISVNWPFGPARAGARSLSHQGFTLIELLVVIAIIGVLSAITLPVLGKAKQKAIQTGCLSNLKNVGIALQSYADDNENTLPGPAFSGARASYDKNASSELIWYIANELGSPPPSTLASGKAVVVDVFVCPGYRRYAPDLTSMVGRKCYLLNDDIDPDPNNRVPPFGYPEIGGAPAIAPLKTSDLDAYGSTSSLFAITDVDKINVPSPTVSWWSDLPAKPVHGSVRNDLFFDGHVEAVPVNW